MRRLVAISLVSFIACSGARPSRWEPREPLPGPRIVCHCDGNERGPKPGEASSDSDDTVILAMCEGKVRDCHPARGGGPHANQLD